MNKSISRSINFYIDLNTYILIDISISMPLCILTHLSIDLEIDQYTDQSINQYGFNQNICLKIFELDCKEIIELDSLTLVISIIGC